MKPHEITDEVMDAIRAVLKIAAAFDQRTVGKTDVLAWSLAVGEYSELELTEAVVAHYCETNDRVMPAHVRRIVKARRADRIDHNVAAIVQTARDSLLPADGAAFVAELRARTGEMAELRRPPRVPELEAPRQPPRYVGTPGQAGFTRKPHPAVEAEDTREALLRARAKTRKDRATGEDRVLNRARAVLALVDDPAVWVERARAALDPTGAAPPAPRDVTVKAAELIRADEITRREEAS